MTSCQNWDLSSGSKGQQQAITANSSSAQCSNHLLGHATMSKAAMSTQGIWPRVKSQFPQHHSEGPQVTGTGELIINQTFKGRPPNPPVFTVPQAMIVHGEQVSGDSIVCDLNLKCVLSDTVPSSHILVDDVPSGQIAHSLGNLNSHVNQVLLRNRLWSMGLY